jgi:hypothetical protein
VPILQHTTILCLFESVIELLRLFTTHYLLLCLFYKVLNFHTVPILQHFRPTCDINPAPIDNTLLDYCAYSVKPHSAHLTALQVKPTLVLPDEITLLCLFTTHYCRRSFFYLTKHCNSTAHFLRHHCVYFEN